MTKYTFFDTETATHTAGSICQIALIEIIDEQMTNGISLLIKPEPFFMSYHNQQIHGISLDDLTDAPTFKEAWPQIAKFFTADHIVVAHNALFDLTQLKAIARQYHLDLEPFQYLCTVRLTRLLVPHLKSYSLGNLVSFNHHHDALADTKACLMVYKQLGFKRIEHLIEKDLVIPGQLNSTMKINHYRYKQFIQAKKESN